jgi:hypothetical protein
MTAPVVPTQLNRFKFGERELHAEMNDYETVAASQTDQVIGTTGAVDDHLAGIIIVPAVVACGLVTVKDSTTVVFTFVGGGTTALQDCKPFYVPIGLKSKNGAWKITTGANVSVVACGNFTP